MKSTILSLFFIVVACMCAAQEANTKVAFIGEDEKEYEQLMASCGTPLLYVSGNSMDKAYDIWTQVLADMTSKADTQGLDIKGVKIWINMFWEADGSIKKILYYPKPKSKNMDFDQLTAFFNSFASDYNLDLDYESCFSHHGTAAFPVTSILTNANEGK